MKQGIKYLAFIFAAACLSTCKVPYTPPPITANNNYLVVEGIINISDSTYINLSRTVMIGAKTTTKPELKATITIESNTGSSYALKEVGNGLYSAPSYNLSASGQYRLRIHTSNANTYTSDFEPTKITPPIDTMIRNFKADGLYVSVNAHDATGNTRYYRWDFTETWQFTSYFQSTATAQYSDTAKSVMSPWLPGIGIAVLPRKNDIYHCWAGSTSHLVTLNNSAGLTQDVIQNQAITYVPSSSEKLSIRYRINIKQYALTKDAYDFWTLLQKNTEQLGSIFDSQPSATIGNIHNINIPSEPVIGYISACSVSQQTVYINYTDLPKSYIADYLNNSPYNPYTCQAALSLVAVPDPKFPLVIDRYDELDLFISNYPYTLETPIAIITPFKPGDGYSILPSGSATGSYPICVDCTLRGTNVKPAFWQ